MNISASMKQFSINLFLHKLKFPKELRFNEICTTCRSLANASLKITTPFKLHRLEKGPDRQVSVTKQDAVSMYTKMTVIRRLETIASSLYKEKAIRGFCHLYSGQEAVAVGMHAAMRKGDGLTTSYRCHPWVWLFGGTYEQLLGELCGKVIGSSRGKGGSMHVYSKDFYGGNGIVGAQVPLGTGVGLANHYFKNGKVSFVLYGDGAANQGQVFESYNMAKLWTLPVIYVCENNKYGMGTSMQRSSASYTYYTRGDYIPGLQIFWTFHVRSWNIVSI
ncbi:hypothetical protein O3M35_002436 [Rhynocoris fuscipes]|uniref:Dehydrogenase E1 component domain-containing protein n=1 Tax=Rhynocoris fuscipes TaxID=488301 RepID=A0AAW1CS45_9HEMI